MFELVLPFVGSVAITLLLRRLDKSSVNMRKLKTLIERGQKELVEVSQKKKEELRDVTSQFDLLLIESDKYLNGLKKELEEAKHNLTHIQDSRYRLSQMDTELQSLEGTTRSVQEQLRFINDGLTKIDDHQGKIKDLQNHIREVDEEAARMTQTFQASIKQRSENIFQQLEAKVEEIEVSSLNHYNNLKTELFSKQTDLITQINQSYQEMEKSLRSGARELTESFEKRVSSQMLVISDLESKINDYDYVLSEKIPDMVGNLKNDISSEINIETRRLDDLQELFTTLSGDLKEKFEGMRFDLEAHRKNIFQEIFGEAERVRKHVSDLDMQSLSKKDEIVRAAQEEALRVRDSIEEFNTIYLNARQNVFKEAEKKEKEVLTQLKHLQDESRDILSALQEYGKENTAELSLTIETALSDIQRKSELVFSTGREELEKENQEILVYLNNLKNETQEALQEFRAGEESSKERMSRLLQSALIEAEQNSKEIFNSEFNRFKDETDKTMRYLQELRLQTQESLQEFKDNKEESMSVLNSLVAKLTLSVRETSREAFEHEYEKFQKENNVILKYLSELKEQSHEAWKNFEKEKEAGFTSIRNLVEIAVEKVKNDSHGVFQEEKEFLRREKVLFENENQKLLEQLRIFKVQGESALFSLQKGEKENHERINKLVEDAVERVRSESHEVFENERENFEKDRAVFQKENDKLMAELHHLRNEGEAALISLQEGEKENSEHINELVELAIEKVRIESREVFASERNLFEKDRAVFQKENDKLMEQLQYLRSEGESALLSLQKGEKENQDRINNLIEIAVERVNSDSREVFANERKLFEKDRIVFQDENRMILEQLHRLKAQGEEALVSLQEGEKANQKRVNEFIDLAIEKVRSDVREVFANEREELRSENQLVLQQFNALKEQGAEAIAGLQEDEKSHYQKLQELIELATEKVQKNSQEVFMREYEVFTRNKNTFAQESEELLEQLRALKKQGEENFENLKASEKESQEKIYELIDLAIEKIQNDTFEVFTKEKELFIQEHSLIQKENRMLFEQLQTLREQSEHSLQLLQKGEKENHESITSLVNLTIDKIQIDSRDVFQKERAIFEKEQSALHEQNRTILKQLNALKEQGSDILTSLQEDEAISKQRINELVDLAVEKVQTDSQEVFQREYQKFEKQNKMMLEQLLLLKQESDVALTSLRDGEDENYQKLDDLIHVAIEQVRINSQEIFDQEYSKFKEKNEEVLSELELLKTASQASLHRLQTHEEKQIDSIDKLLSAAVTNLRKNAQNVFQEEYQKFQQEHQDALLYLGELKTESQKLLQNIAADKDENFIKLQRFIDEALESVRDESRQVFEHEYQKFKDEHDDLQSLIRQLENRVDVAENSAHENLEVFAHELKLSDEKLKEQTERMILQLNENSKSLTKRYEDTLAEKMAQLAKDLHNEFESIQREFEDFKETSHDQAQNYQNDFENLSERFQEDYKSFSEKLKRLGESIEERFSSEVEKKQTYFTAQLKTLTQELEEARQDTAEEINKRNQNLYKRLSELELSLIDSQKTLKQKWSDETDKFGEKIEEHEQRLTQNAEKWEARLETLVKDGNHIFHYGQIEVEKKRAEILQHFDKELKEKLEELKTTSLEWEEKNNRNLSEQIADFRRQLTEKEKSALERVDQMDARFQEMKKTLEGKQSDILDLVSTEREKIQRTLKESMNEQMSLFETFFAQESQNKNQELQSIGAQTLLQIETDTQKVLENFMALKESVNEELQEFQTKHRKILNSIADETRQTGDEVLELKDLFVSLQEESANMEEAQTNMEKIRTLLHEFDQRLENVNVKNGELKDMFMRIEELKDLRLKLDSEFVLMSQKRDKVDKLDEKFQLILSLHEAIDEKGNNIEQVKSLLDDVMNRFQELEVQKQNVESKIEDYVAQQEFLQASFARLQDTQDNMENFYKHLSEIDSNIERADRKSNSLKDELDKLQNQMIGLHKKESDLQELKQRFLDIEDLIDDIENRKGQIDTMRKRMEELRTQMSSDITEFENIEHNAEKKVKQLMDVLSALEVGGGKNSAIVKSVGVGDKREIVKKLAAFGWSTNEIAQQMHLDKGSIETILSTAKSSHS